MEDYLIESGWLEIMANFIIVSIFVGFAYVLGHEAGEKWASRTVAEKMKDRQVSQPRTLYEKIKYKIRLFFRPPNY